MSEDDLIRSLGSRTSTGERSWRCPGAGRLAAYADGRLRRRPRRRLERHLADCGFCLGQVAFLARVEEVGPAQDVPPALLARARRLAEPPARGWLEAGRLGRGRWRRGLVPAAVALVLGVATIGLWQLAGGPAEIPGSPSPQTVRGAREPNPGPEILAPREGARMPGHRPEFRCRPVAGGLSYRFELLTADGDLVWEARSAATNLRLPAEIRLAEGGKYFVSVSARLADGRSVRAPAVGFEVAASP